MAKIRRQNCTPRKAAITTILMTRPGKLVKMMAKIRRQNCMPRRAAITTIVMTRLGIEIANSRNRGERSTRTLPAYITG